MIEPKDKNLIARIRQKLAGTLFYIDDEDEPTDECVHFYFVADRDGQEVICDCVLYTLRLHHEGDAAGLEWPAGAQHCFGPDGARRAPAGSMPGETMLA